MVRKRFAVALVIGSLLPVIAYAGAAARSGQLFQERHHSGELAPGTVQRIGVKLPINAKIPKVEVFADVSDMGDSTRGWKKCNIERKTCAVGDVRIVRFHRGDRDGDPERWQELSVDVANENAAETRSVKLLVTYQPQGGTDLKQCRLDTDCGWSETIPAGSE